MGCRLDLLGSCSTTSSWVHRLARDLAFLTYQNSDNNGELGAGSIEEVVGRASSPVVLPFRYDI
jgi:hypothetical protein